jgi:hypothetical protein
MAQYARDARQLANRPGLLLVGMIIQPSPGRIHLSRRGRAVRAARIAGASELCRHAGVSQTTAGKRSRELGNLLRLAPFDPELSRRQIAEEPLGNLVEVGGLVVPADMLDLMDDGDVRRQCVGPSHAPSEIDSNVA